MGLVAVPWFKLYRAVEAVLVPIDFIGSLLDFLCGWNPLEVGSHDLPNGCVDFTT